MLTSNSVAVTIPVTSNPPAVIIESSPNVETPVTFNWSNVNPPTILAPALISTAELKVETPATTSSSTSSWPSISKTPLISTAPNVAIPATFNWSILAPPVTSRRALASTRAENVDTPDTFKVVLSNCPVTVIPIPDVSKRFKLFQYASTAPLGETTNPLLVLVGSK